MNARDTLISRFSSISLVLAGTSLLGLSAAQGQSSSASLPREKTAGTIEQVAAFTGPIPTGVTVSSDGRIFVCFPRAGDPVAFTVAEIVNGRAVPYPNAAINRFDRARVARTFVSMRSIVVDPANRLWVLDTGVVGSSRIIPSGAKLIGISLTTNRIFKAIYFPRNVALPSTYLNDIRFDLTVGRGGVAYITDSSDTGPNGIIVVDLATGQSYRRLNNHPSTQAEPGFLPFVEGRALLQDLPRQPPQFIPTGSDGIAISRDGTRLYYCPLASRELYSVATDALLSPGLADTEVGATVQNEGMKPASDGLESDAQRRIYATAYEHNAVVRRAANGRYQTLVHDPRALWPDTMSIANDGYLYSSRTSYTVSRFITTAATCARSHTACFA